MIICKVNVILSHIVTREERKMSIAYGIGFLCGIAIVAIGGIIVKKKLFKEKAVYDERQEREQGVACKIAFYTLLAYNLIMGVVDMTFDTGLGGYVMMIIGVGISVVIYAVYCIWKEAYFPINQSYIKWAVLLIVIGLLCAVIGIMNLKADTGSETGIGCMVCAGMVIIIGLVSLIRLRIDNREGEEEMQ